MSTPSERFTLARFTGHGTLEFRGLNRYGHTEWYTDPKEGVWFDAWDQAYAEFARSAQINVGIISEHAINGDLFENEEPEVPDWVADFLNRRVLVETALLEAAAGKRPLPTAAECRALARKLGVPDQLQAIQR